uniref:Uncharacterized protein n=1 Tax=Mus spicilegus TaxID=10103 RepID=A0A8C6I1R6_MUSSI
MLSRSLGLCYCEADKPRIGTPIHVGSYRCEVLCMWLMWVTGWWLILVWVSYINGRFRKDV